VKEQQINKAYVEVTACWMVFIGRYCLL